MRKQILLMTTMLLMAVSGVMAQAPNIQWAKCYGGTNHDYAYSVNLTTNGGYIVAGSSESNDSNVSGNHGGGDSWVVKLNSNGALQWQKSIGGTDYEDAHSIQQTNDGGFIIAGESFSNDGDVTGNHGGGDCWVVKLNASGTIQWQKSIGGTNFDFANSIQQTTDGGYIVAGRSFSNDGDVSGHHGSADSSDYWVAKLNSTGAIQWQKSLGGTGNDLANSIQQTNDGGFILAGQSRSNDGDVTGNHGLWDYWIIKLNSSGIIQWQKTYGGSDMDIATYAQQTTDGGYIVAGYSWSNNGDVTGNHGNSDDFWIVKLDNAGTIQWQKSLGGSADDMAISIQQTVDSGYIIAGSSDLSDGDVTGNHGGTDFWIVKINTTGTIQWQKSLGGNSMDYANSIKRTNDGGYIIAGTSQSNDGDVNGNHTGSVDYWVVKLEGTTGVEEITTSSISISPNPTTGQVTIKGITQPTIAVYNLMGQKVVASQGSNEVSLANLPAGMYLVQVFSKDMELVKSEKVILNR